MPTMTKEHYREIRCGVMHRRWEKELPAGIEKIMSEPGAKTFSTVDELMTYLDSLVLTDDHSAQSEKHR